MKLQYADPQFFPSFRPRMPFSPRLLRINHPNRRIGAGSGSSLASASDRQEVMKIYDSEHGNSTLDENSVGFSRANRSEPSKRPLSSGGKPFEVSKRQKQLEQSEEFAKIPVTDRSPASVLSGECTKSGEADDNAAEDGVDVSWSTGLDTHVCSLIQHGNTDGGSSPAWTLSSFPNCFENRILVKELDGLEHVFGASVTDSLWKKSVLIGVDHQAVIPEWRPRSGSQHCGDQDDNGDDDSRKWISNTVFPGIVDLSGPTFAKLQHGSECDCPDEDSIRCVQHHVMAARNELKMALGESLFNELGLGEMGECVALNWSDEEEELFHEIVYSNPASLGHNFWDKLSLAFPERSSHEIVSYYFNVFMLRKRAQQNRSESMYIDSDDDEWQESDEDGEGAEEDDTAIESPLKEYSMVCGNMSKDSMVGRFDEDEFDGFKIRHDTKDGPAKDYLQNYLQDSVIHDSAFTLLEPKLHEVDQKCAHSFYASDDFAGHAVSGFLNLQFDPHVQDESLIDVNKGDEILSTYDAADIIGLLGKDDFLTGHDITEFFLD